MEAVKDLYNDLFGFGIKKFLIQGLFLFLTLGTPIFLWNYGKIYTNTESPVVVVLTGSMEPAFFRGDLLLITHFKGEIEVGDIIAYKVSNQPIPIVHRAMVKHIDFHKREKYFLLSKGDNNPVDDIGLYPNNRLWLKESEIIGKIRGYCPYLGYITIIINDYPSLKYLFILMIILGTMTSTGDN